MQGDEDSSLASPSPVQSPEHSSPILSPLFLKALVGERGYNFEVQPHVSPIYKEPPVLKISPFKNPGN